MSLSTPAIYAPCTVSTFHNPSLDGASFLSIQATPVSNYSKTGFYTNHGIVDVKNASFCNVTISYTHPEENDHVNVQVWLPSYAWNGKMQSIGGGGFAAGLYEGSFSDMAGAINEGYAAVSSDAGVDGDPKNWALLSPGNVNLYLLNNLGSNSQYSSAIIGKSIVKDFYGTPPKYSYWNGCSQGGRQGLMLAQRYPALFDGIAASAPVIHWSTTLVAGYWATLFMKLNDYCAFNCEYEAITAAAIAACDGLDGVVDGVITDSTKCNFDPKTLIGETIKCSDTETDVKISTAAVEVAQEIWEGAKRADHSSLWFGLNKDAGLRSYISISKTNSSSCVSDPWVPTADWIRLFVLKDQKADLSHMTRKDFDHFAHSSVQQYASFMEANDADLSEFRDSGRKMITFHGLADQVISSEGSTKYYDDVIAIDPEADDYYRLFLAPGVGHCFGGSGAFPGGTFDALVRWVEEGLAPKTLEARSTPDASGSTFTRPLCSYPKKQLYKGSGSVTESSSFECK